jgi:hypothetical protein
MACGRISAAPRPGVRAMVEAVDLTPRGFAAIESPWTWRKMRDPSVRYHRPSSRPSRGCTRRPPRSGRDVAAHRAHPRAPRESAANSDPSSTLRTSSRLIWWTTRACDRLTGLLARELPSTASRSPPSTPPMTTGSVYTLSAIASEVADQARQQLNASQRVRVGAGLVQETGDPTGQGTAPQANISSSPGSWRTDGLPRPGILFS